MAKIPRVEDIVMPFGDHLEELRARLLRGLIAPFLLAIPCIFFGKYILHVFIVPVQSALLAEGLPARLQALSPIEAFVAYLKIAIVAALVFASPVLVYQIWRFVAPGLHEHERRFARLLVPFGVVLIIIGVTFLFLVVLPLSMRMLVRFGKGLDVGASIVAHESPPGPGELAAQPRPQMPNIPFLDQQPFDMKPGDMYFDTVANQVRLMRPDGKVLVIDAQVDAGLTQQFQLQTYLNLVLGLILAFSLAFQLPLVLLLLGWVGLISIDDLKKKRKYAFIGAFVIGAVLTPPDVVSQITLAVPLYLLYELSIVLLRVLPLSRVIGTTEADTGS